MVELSGCSFLENIRRFEVERVRAFFEPAISVLEIGGADGCQASVIASWGCSIRSLDIAERPEYEKTYYRVETYNGSHIPFPAAHFDILFSSNVLEHVRDIPSMLEEIHRVLKNDGVCIQILPSPAWRFWTMVTHYPSLLMSAIREGRGEAHPYNHPPEKSSHKRTLGDKLKQAFFPPPHGEYRTSISELYYFSAHRWKQVFRMHGFQILRIQPAGLFYTGHFLYPGLSLTLRHSLASIGGSAMLIYILKKAPEGP